MNNDLLSVRIFADNPNHHLWDNNGTWWCHFTVHLRDFTKQRNRVSLKTSDVRLARQRRDALLRSPSYFRAQRGESALAAETRQPVTAGVHAEPGGGHAWDRNGDQSYAG